MFNYHVFFTNISSFNTNNRHNNNNQKCFPSVEEANKTTVCSIMYYMMVSENSNANWHALFLQFEQHSAQGRGALQISDAGKLIAIFSGVQASPNCSSRWKTLKIQSPSVLGCVRCIFGFVMSRLIGLCGKIDMPLIGGT